MIDNDFRPHITHAIFPELDSNLLSYELQTFASQFNKFQLILREIGVSPIEPSGVYLLPTIIDNLLQIHKQFYNNFSKIINEFKNEYLQNKWFTHCTVAQKLTKNESKKVVSTLLDKYNAMKVEVTEIGFGKTGPFLDIISFELGKK